MALLRRFAPSLDEIRNDVQPDTKWSWCSGNPKRNLGIFITQFLVTHTTILLIIVVSLYNLTVQPTNREIWIGLVSWMGGVIVPSPGSMKANKFIYPVKSAGEEQRGIPGSNLTDDVDSIPVISRDRAHPQTRSQS